MGRRFSGVLGTIADPPLTGQQQAPSTTTGQASFGLVLDPSLWFTNFVAQPRFEHEHFHPSPNWSSIAADIWSMAGVHVIGALLFVRCALRREASRQMQQFSGRDPDPVVYSGEAKSNSPGAQHSVPKANLSNAEG